MSVYGGMASVKQKLGGLPIASTVMRPSPSASRSPELVEQVVNLLLLDLAYSAKIVSPRYWANQERSSSSRYRRSRCSRVIRFLRAGSERFSTVEDLEGILQAAF
jgi:hypothetical protein